MVVPPENKTEFFLKENFAQYSPLTPSLSLSATLAARELPARYLHFINLQYISTIYLHFINLITILMLGESPMMTFYNLWALIKTYEETIGEKG